jgi:hypothetical protein
MTDLIPILILLALISIPMLAGIQSGGTLLP